MPTAFFRMAFSDEPDVVATAPGRIEFIGNHVDYNGGQVLGAAIDRHVTVALRRRKDEQIRLRSSLYPQTVTLDLDSVAPQHGLNAWSNYVLGVLFELRRHNLDVERGFDLAVTSTLPPGAGLGSSAALELATAHVLNTAYEGDFDDEALVHRCRKAENTFVGMPCGILDQGISAFGKEGHLLLVDASAETFTPVPLPDECELWIFNTRLQHALVESLYADRQRECMEARDVLRRFYPGLAHLAKIAPVQVDAHLADLPAPLHQRARHIASESERVAKTLEALEAQDLDTVGALMIASHISSRDDFENSTRELDLLVDRLSKTPQVYGARLSGGGFGGAVIALTEKDFHPRRAEAISARYAARFGGPPTILPCRIANGAGVDVLMGSD